MDPVQKSDYMEALLSPHCTITQVSTFVVGWISFERLDRGMDKNRNADGPRSYLHFTKQPNTKHEVLTLKSLTMFSHLCSFNVFLLKFGHTENQNKEQRPFSLIKVAFRSHFQFSVVELQKPLTNLPASTSGSLVSQMPNECDTNAMWPF